MTSYRRIFRDKVEKAVIDILLRTEPPSKASLTHSEIMKELDKTGVVASRSLVGLILKDLMSNHKAHVTGRGKKGTYHYKWGPRGIVVEDKGPADNSAPAPNDDQHAVLLKQLIKEINELKVEVGKVKTKSNLILHRTSSLSVTGALVSRIAQELGVKIE